MAGNAGLGKAVQLAVGNLDPVLSVVDKIAEAGAEHDAGARGQIDARADKAGVLLRPASLRLRQSSKALGRRSPRVSVSTTPVASQRWTSVDAVPNSLRRCRQPPRGDAGHLSHSPPPRDLRSPAPTIWAMADVWAPSLGQVAFSMLQPHRSAAFAADRRAAGSLYGACARAITALGRPISAQPPSALLT